MQKTYYKTASLISNSCKAIALLSDQTPGVAMLAFEYGKNLVCKFPKVIILPDKKYIISGTIMKSS